MQSLLPKVREAGSFFYSISSGALDLRTASMPSIAGISAAASFSLHSSMIKETANSGAFTGHFGLEYFSGVHFQRTDKRIQNLQFGVSLEVSTLSDDLDVFKLHLAKEFTDIPERYCFVGSISGKLYLMNDFYNIPEVVRINLDKDAPTWYSDSGLVSGSGAQLDASG